MAKKTYKDAVGHEIEVDDEVSLIHGHPDLKPVERDSTTDTQFTPVKSFHHPEEKVGQDWRTKKAKPASGYSHPVDDPDFNKLIGFKNEGKV